MMNTIQNNRSQGFEREWREHVQFIQPIGDLQTPERLEFAKIIANAVFNHCVNDYLEELEKKSSEEDDRVEKLEHEIESLRESMQSTIDKLRKELAVGK